MFWNFTQHFGWRGRPEHHDLKLDYFLTSKDNDGTEFVYFVEGPTKTRGQGLSLDDYDSGDENEQRILFNVISGHSAASVPNRPVLHLAQQQVCLATSYQSHTLRPAITEFSGPLPQTVPVIPSVPTKNHTIICPVVQQSSSLANREILKDIITANSTTPASSNISQMSSRLLTYNLHKCNVTINVSSTVENKQETKSKARKRVRLIQSDSKDDLHKNIFFPADDDFGSVFQELQY